MTKRYIDFAPVKKQTASKAGVSQGGVSRVRSPQARATSTNTVKGVSRKQSTAVHLTRTMPSEGAVPRTRMKTRDNAMVRAVRPTSVRKTTNNRTSVAITPQRSANVQRASTSQQSMDVRRTTGVQRGTTAQRGVGVQRGTTAQRGVGVQRGRATGMVAPVRRSNGAVSRSGSVGVASKRPVATMATSTSGAGTVKRSSTVKLGEIEDLTPTFVETNVPKRPINEGMEAVQTSGSVARTKSKKLGGRLKFRNRDKKELSKAEAKKGKTASSAVTSEKQGTYAVPKSPFINQDKVEKRPLSKNNYQQRKVVAPAKEPVSSKNGKPVTIIAKPKKDSKVGMVVTIILTIILGAVAGTVAFLLLPK